MKVVANIESSVRTKLAEILEFNLEMNSFNRRVFPGDWFNPGGMPGIEYLSCT